MEHGHIDPTAFEPADAGRGAPGQQHPPKEPAASQLNGGHAGQKLKGGGDWHHFFPPSLQALPTRSGLVFLLKSAPAT